MIRCEMCREREASVFLTQLLNGDTMEVALCETCGQPLSDGDLSPESLFEFLHPGESFVSFADRALEVVAATRAEYTREAVLFVRDGVAHAVRSLARLSSHVSALELLETLRSLAIERYGAAARDQLRAWGVTSCEDFGEIVFTLIESGVFGKQPEDSKEDFENGYDFATAFPVRAPNT